MAEAKARIKINKLLEESGWLSSSQIEATKIPLPPLSIQQTILNRIEQEQQLVNANKQLIQIFEQK